MKRHMSENMQFTNLKNDPIYGKYAIQILRIKNKK